MNRGSNMQGMGVKEIGFSNNQQDWTELGIRRSRFYYIKGYELAKTNQLTHAITSLKKSIGYSKYNIHAKNLLGLIYFQRGQIGEALKCWVLSESIEKENNIATYYMHYIQNQPRRLENYNEAIGLYNRAIKYLHRKNDDMAIIRLKRAIHLNSQFIEAKNLLALCYLYQNQYQKAEQQINATLAIDRCNEKALQYLKTLKTQYISKDDQVKSVVKAPHLNDQQIDRKIKPSKVLNKGNILGRYMIYFLFGMAAMYTAENLLIIPEVTKNLEQKIVQKTNQASDLKVQIDVLKKDYDQKLLQLQDNNQKLTVDLEKIQQENTSILQKNKLLKVEAYLLEKEWIEASDLLYTINQHHLSEEDKARYHTYANTVYPKAIDQLYQQGYRAYTAKNFVEAMQHFEKTTQLGTPSRSLAHAIYYMGRIEEDNGHVEQAIKHYSHLVENFREYEASQWAAGRIRRLE